MGGSITQRKKELLSDLPNEVIFMTTNTVFIKDYNFMMISVIIIIIIIMISVIIIIIIIISNSTRHCTPKRNYYDMYV
jgi:hypothetical protein